jgi:alkanesulfonate monooxygenase SsuD/methylene tetrahydromethanopterin reductase-like flavin-dependent oxidoreductase (luciferase family)
MFLNPCTVKQGKKVIAEARSAALAEGRDPSSLKFFPCIVPIIGRTEEEAKEKYEKAKSVADVIGGLAQFSGYTGIDMSVFQLDEPFSSSTLKGGAGIESVLNAFEASTDSSSSDSASSEPWTPRRLGMRMALGGLHPCPVSSVTQVADIFEEWVIEADYDGFNVAYVSNPGSFEDIVDLLVPELRRRGLMWDDYDVPGGTFRENLLGTRTLREDHFGSRFKYGREDAVAAVAEKSEVKSEEVEKKEVNGVQQEKVPVMTASQPIAI